MQHAASALINWFIICQVRRALPNSAGGCAAAASATVRGPSLRVRARARACVWRRLFRALVGCRRTLHYVGVVPVGTDKPCGYLLTLLLVPLLSPSIVADTTSPLFPQYARQDPPRHSPRRRRGRRGPAGHHQQLVHLDCRPRRVLRCLRREYVLTCVCGVLHTCLSPSRKANHVSPLPSTTAHHRVTRFVEPRILTRARSFAHHLNHLPSFPPSLPPSPRQ